MWWHSVLVYFKTGPAGKGCTGALPETCLFDREWRMQSWRCLCETAVASHASPAVRCLLPLAAALCVNRCAVLLHSASTLLLLILILLILLVLLVHLVQSLATTVR